MRISLILICIAVSLTAAAQTCVTIKGNTTSGLFKQSHLDSRSTTIGQLWQPEIAASAWTCDGLPCNTRAMLRYELSSIPQDAVITSAVLYLYAKVNASNGDHVNPTYGTNNASVLMRITTAWDNPGWQNQPAITSQGMKTLPQSTSGAQNYFVDLGDFVQYWVNNPSENHGMLFRLVNETYYNSMIFHSGTSPENVQPTLEICYTTPGGSGSSGYIGIGTNSPTAQLHTTGSVRFQGLTTDNSQNKVIVADVSGNLFLRDVFSFPANNVWYLTGNAATNPATHFLGTTDNQRLVFRTNNVEKMTILSNGYTGIGTTSPTARLHVNSATVVGQSNPSNIRFENLQVGSGYNVVIDQNGYLYRSSSTSAGTANFSANNSEEMTRMQLEIQQLKKEIAELKQMIKKSSSPKR